MKNNPVNRLGGAPKGNRNALKTGQYTRELRELRKLVRQRVRAARAAIAFAERTDLMVRQAHHEGLNGVPHPELVEG